MNNPAKRCVDLLITECRVNGELQFPWNEENIDDLKNFEDIQEIYDCSAFFKYLDTLPEDIKNKIKSNIEEINANNYELNESQKKLFEITKRIVNKHFD